MQWNGGRVIILILLIILALIAVNCYRKKGRYEKNTQIPRHLRVEGRAEGGADGRSVGVLLIVDAPPGVGDMRKKYVLHDQSPSHITLGYLKPDYDEKQVLEHLKSLEFDPLKFDHWRHTDKFIGVNVEDTSASKIRSALDPVSEFVDFLPRSPPHVSLAFNQDHSQLNYKVYRDIHLNVHTPFTAPVTSIQIWHRNPSNADKWDMKHEIKL